MKKVFNIINIKNQKKITILLYQKKNIFFPIITSVLQKNEFIKIPFLHGTWTGSILNYWLTHFYHPEHGKDSILTETN